MNFELKLAQRRTALLKNHVQELKELTALEMEARVTLTQRYNQERKNLLPRVDKCSLEWTQLIINQSSQLAALISVYSQKRIGILERQDEETRQLEQQIDLERNSHSSSEE